MWHRSAFTSWCDPTYRSSMSIVGSAIKFFMTLSRTKLTSFLEVFVWACRSSFSFFVLSLFLFNALHVLLKRNEFVEERLLKALSKWHFNRESNNFLATSKFLSSNRLRPFKILSFSKFSEWKLFKLWEMFPSFNGWKSSNY